MSIQNQNHHAYIVNLVRIEKSTLYLDQKVSEVFMLQQVINLAQNLEKFAKIEKFKF